MKSFVEIVIIPGSCLHTFRQQKEVCGSTNLGGGKINFHIKIYYWVKNNII